ncbi:hypothetical protein MRX96_050245 [Rhipicephalus microplus]
MDRCWSVAGTSCVAAFFTVVMMTNSGFMYLSFLEEFDVNRESASWPASVLSIVGHLAGILVSLGQGHVSVFQMGIVGSVFLWAGLLGATFAPNMTWMTLTVGLIHGTGVGVVCLTLIVVVMMYFDKYRGIASGMKFAGYSLSSLLYPVILTSLKDAYGFRGALLICAALTMNVTALSLLLKEPPWWTSKPRFYAVVLAVVAIDYTVAVFPATIVDYALDKGSARRHADLSVSYCAPAEIMGRIALPFVADSGLASRTTLVSANFFLLGGTFLVVPVTCSFLSYILVCACSTMLLGCLMSLKPVVIADYFGIDAVAGAWGSAGVILLPLLLCSPAITGEH